MITIIVGNVPWFKDQTLARLRKDHNSEDIVQFYGPECKARAISEACCHRSLLGGEAFVLVRRADKLPRKEQEALLKFLIDVPDDAHLVLMADKVDRRLKFWQQALKKADVVSVEPPPLKERRSWLQVECRRRGLNLAPDAGSVLVEVGHADFNQAILLLEKLELFLGKSKEVSREAIETCTVGTLPAKIFEWAEAVGGGDWKRAFTILQSLWSHQEQPLAILALLIRHFRLLLKTIEYRSLWGRRNDLARALGVPVFAVDRYRQQASQYTRDTLIDLWQQLLATDRGLKSSPGKKEWIVEELLWNLKKSLGNTKSEYRNPKQI